MKIFSTSLSVLLGLTTLSTVTALGVNPLVAQAYTSEISISLARQPGETYQTLLRRSEAIARAAVQRSFDSDILVTKVDVMVLGENKGAIAPLLRLNVERQNWKQFPDSQRWSQYFPSTESLLGFTGLEAEELIQEVSSTEETSENEEAPEENE